MAELDDVFVPKGRTSPSNRPACPKDLSKYAVLWAMMIAESGPTGCSVEGANNRAHRIWALLKWRSGKSLPELESWLDRSGEGQPVSGPLRSIVDRTIDMLPATAAIAARVAPEQTDNLRRVLTASKNQLSVGGDAGAGEIFSLRLGLSRAECRQICAIGVSAEALRKEVVARRAEIVAVLGEKRFELLVAKLGDARHVRRRSGMSDQLVFEGLGDLTGL